MAEDDGDLLHWKDDHARPGVGIVRTGRKQRFGNGLASDHRLNTVGGVGRFGERGRDRQDQRHSQDEAEAGEYRQAVFRHARHLRAPSPPKG
jgi:hypothetical protein